MLGWRLTVSAILIPTFIGICYLDAQTGSPAYYLLALCLCLAGRCAWEFADLLHTRSFQPSFALIAVGSAAVILGSWTGLTADQFLSMAVGGWVMSFAVLISFLRGAVRYREPGSALESVAIDVLGIAYVGLLLAMTSQLRWIAGESAGYLALGSLVIGAKCGDIGAYTLGRLFGKRKMVPRLSPGKTWMGFWGAILGAGGGCWAWFTFATPLFLPGETPCGWYWSILYGVVLGVVGLVGDLCESLIKRDVERKDSAALMPGFGGLLDLLDSILYAGPVALLMWYALPLRTW